MDEHSVDLVWKLLTLNPATRITAFEALDYDYFRTEPSHVILVIAVPWSPEIHLSTSIRQAKAQD